MTVDWMPAFARPLLELRRTDTALALTGLLPVAWLANWITRRILQKLLSPRVNASPMQGDDALLARGVLSRLARLLAVLPEFGLRLYQQPGGADVMSGIEALASRAGARPAPGPASASKA